MDEEEVTSEMIEAAQAVEAEWRAHQSGPLFLAVYRAMRAARPGAPKPAEEQQDKA